MAENEEKKRRSAVSRAEFEEMWQTVRAMQAQLQHVCSMVYSRPEQKKPERELFG